MLRDELLERFAEPIKVLDHGFVRFIDSMGDDAAVCQAARVSYGAGTKTVHEDRGLIRYLMRQHHTSPFEQCEIKLHCKMPIFVARQWVRHRTFHLNEYSGRYSEMPDQMYRPEKWRGQGKVNKQGSSGDMGTVIGPLVSGAQKKIQKAIREDYEYRLESGVAREQARIDLPLSQYTEWYWKGDLHNLFHFLRLRLDVHAQYEIRVYAEAIAEIVKVWVPECWSAFVDYRRDAYTLSRMEVELMKWSIAASLGALRNQAQGLGMSKREIDSFMSTFFAGRNETPSS